MSTRHTAQQRGFTLLEILVALAILATALAALLGAVSRQVDNTAYLRDKTLAHWVGMNVLAEFQLKQNWPRKGKADGQAQQADRDWWWEVQAQETPDADIQKLVLTVYADKAQKQPMLVLERFIGN
jgi:general secretion pathway protein I